MRNILLSALFFLTIVNSAFSQDTRKSKKYFQKAMDYFYIDDYVNSKVFLKKTLEQNPNKKEAYEVLGEIYFTSKEYNLAINNFKISDSISSAAYLKFKLANSYFMLGDYRNSKINFEYYLSKASPNNKGTKTAKARIDNCNFALEAMKTPVDFNPINVGEGINTSGYEYNPVVSADGQTLIYTGVRNKNGRKVEDFFISKLKNGVWQKGVPLPGDVNTNENEGAHCISVDGKLLYFTSCGRREGYGSCDIYVSVNVDGKWSKAFNLGRRVNSESWDAHPTLSSDGSTIIFSSTRKGGKGKKDLWVTKYRNRNWSIPQNLSELNTKGNEVTPYLHADGKTLYFASDGLEGMGGTDFFVSYFDDEINKWGTPQNLGYSINSSRDEYSLMVARDGKTAYFATDALNGFGNMDIYCFVLDVKSQGQNTAYLKGRIIEESNERIIPNSDLVIVDLKTSKQIKSVYIEKGNYKALLPVGRSYAIVAKSPKHLMYSETFNFMKDTVTNFIVKDFKLSKLSKWKKMNLNNINFRSNESILLKESYFELDLLVAFLNANSKYNAQIVGHTDNVGSKENNQVLSLDRAKAVEEYLVKRGINKSRLKSYGKGETQPISKNDTEVGRKKNRRTEIVLF